MAPLLAFWCAALLLAGFAFPIAQRLFRRFPDAGAGLAFPLGLMLCGYGYFVLRSVGILPQGQGGFLLAFALFGLVGLLVARTDPRFAGTARRSSAGIAASAGVFTAAFFGYATFRSYQSAIGGTEQPMDLLFLNAMLESPSYPPEDPWLAGSSVSYYYFGYLQSALLSGVSGTEASAGYNLGLAAVFASTATAAASVCAALARWVLGHGQHAVVAAGALGVALVLFAGSLIGVFEFTAAHERYSEPVYSAFGVESLLPCDQVDADDCYAGQTSPRTQSWYPDEYWYWWRASRIIPDTITEFPAFSFLLGDLHPHVMALPGVLLATALALALWRGQGPLGFHTLRRKPLLGLMLALVFGGLAFQNTWDVLTFSALLGVAVTARNARAGPFPGAALDAVRFLASAAIAAVVLYAPWWTTFASQAGGLYAYAGAGTQPNHAFLQFGALALAAALVIPWAIARSRSTGPLSALVYAPWLPLVPLLAWAVFAAVRGDWSDAVTERGAGGWATLAILAAFIWALTATALVLHQRRSPGAPMAALGAFGLLLLYGAELFFIRDVFFGSIPRLNTVFKLSYQAWVLLAVAGAVALVAAAAEGFRRQRSLVIAAAPVSLLVLLSFAYVIGAVPNRADGFAGDSNIDGLAQLARNNPDEYALTRWIANNTRPGETIIEATGRQWTAGEDGPQLQDGGVSYTDAGRVSSRTGRPTPIGWDAHQVQWRGDTEDNRAEFTRRQDAVDAIYLAEDPAEALAQIDAFDAEYVVLGSLERERYPEAHRIDFDAFLEPVFESGETRVYRVPVSDEVPTS